MTNTDQAFGSFLDCSYKAYLEMKGETKPSHEYATFQAMEAETYSRRAKAALVVSGLGDSHPKGIPITQDNLKCGNPLFLDVTIKDGSNIFRFDALQRIEEPSDLGGFSYIPVLFIGHAAPRPKHKLMLAIAASVLGVLQGLQPATGIAVYGDKFRRARVKLEPFRRKANRVAAELATLANWTRPSRITPRPSI
jgi:predicted RecB family nuclease